MQSNQIKQHALPEQSFDINGKEITVGMFVKVVAKLPEGRYKHPRFINSWTTDMDQFVGKILYVTRAGYCGVTLNSNPTFTFPPFCLEVVDTDIYTLLQEKYTNAELTALLSNLLNVDK